MHMDISFANIFRPFRAMDLVVLQITGLCPVQMDIALSGLECMNFIALKGHNMSAMGIAHRGDIYQIIEGILDLSH